MKLPVYKEVYRDPEFNVHLTQVDWLSVPLTKAITLPPYYYSLGVREFNERWRFVVTGFQEMEGDPQRVYPTVRIDPPGIEIDNLVLVPHSLYDLVEFLMHRNVEVLNVNLPDHKNMNLGGIGDSLVGLLELAKLKDRDLLLGKITSDDCGAVCFLKDRTGDVNVFLHEENDEKWFIPTANIFSFASVSWVLYRETASEIAGFKVPRASFAFAANLYDTSFAVWNEDEWHYFGSLGEFLDGCGAIFEDSFAYGSFIYSPGALAHYETRAVLRLPSLKEIGPFLDKPVSSPPRFLPPLGCLVDTRSPVAIPADTPVIHEPQEVISVLSRLVGCHYLRDRNGQVGTQLISTYLDEERETWVAFVVPRLRI